jgi:hypothetical protein
MATLNPRKRRKTGTIPSRRFPEPTFQKRIIFRHRRNSFALIRQQVCGESARARPETDWQRLKVTVNVPPEAINIGDDVHRVCRMEVFDNSR